MAKRLGWVVVLLGLLIFRLYFSLSYFHVDLWSNAEWGSWIATHGAKGFYYNNIWNNGTNNFAFNSNWTYSWPTQLPLVNLIYSWCHDLSRYLLIDFVRLGNLGNKLGLVNLVDNTYKPFVNWMGQNVTPEIPFSNVFLLTIKLMAIMADMGLAAVIWIIARQSQSKIAWVLPIIYLASPFSWYLSAFWGQYDQLSFLLVLLAFLTVKKVRILSPVLFSISLGIKPTSAIFIPFYLWLMWENRRFWWQYLIGGVIGLSINLYWVSLFSQETSLWTFINHRLADVVLHKSEPRVTVNSYNFWHLFLGDKAANIRELFLWVPYQVWGGLGVLAANMFGLKVYLKDRKNIWLALMIIGVGSWMVGMNMLERYLFGGIVLGLLATLEHKWLRKPWLALSIIFWINLYKNWWQPVLFGGVLQSFHDNYNLASGITFSLLNIILFVYIIRKTYEATR